MDLDHPAHPYEPIEHDVLIGAEQLRKFCRPVRLDGWGELVPDLAKRLGCSNSGLARARAAGRDLRERHVKGLGGKRGKPIPIIHCDRPLDPGSARSFAAPEPILTTGWEDLADCIPDGFEQAVIRKPVFRRLRSCGTHPGLQVPDDHVYKDEQQLVGWRWECPGCRKLVRTIYYPVGVSNLCDWIRFDPAERFDISNLRFQRGRVGYRAERVPRNRVEWELQLERRRRWEMDAVQKPMGTFACRGCHRVNYFSDVTMGGWNQLIAHFSGGLLYGCEVKPPAWYRPGENRKLRNHRKLSSSAPRRQAVLRRLLNGWSYEQIALDLLMSKSAVCKNIARLCEQEDVADRHELAAKLGGAVSPPLNRDERAAKRRFAVKELLLEGFTHGEIAERLGMERELVRQDCYAIYQQHGVSGHGFAARRALAATVGVAARTVTDRKRERVAEMRKRGMSRREIAREMGLSMAAVGWYVKKIRRGEGTVVVDGAEVACEDDRGGGGEGGHDRARIGRMR
jgi:DNA-binding NarL/FixJ family response regulator